MTATTPTTTRRRRRSAALLVGLAALTAAATTAAVPVAAAAPATAPSKAKPTPAPAPAPARTGTFDGTLPDGATWLIDVPTTWNGTLLLYGHGLVPPGSPNPAEVAPDPITRAQLLADGYALAGSSYASTGMAVDEALADQLAVLDVFAAAGRRAEPHRGVGQLAGRPGHHAAPRAPPGPVRRRPVAVRAARRRRRAVEHLPRRAVRALDAARHPRRSRRHHRPGARRSPTSPRSAPRWTRRRRRRRVVPASRSPRRSLDLPGWIGAGNPRPAGGDVDAQEAAQYEHFKTTILFGLVLRADQEARVGGNPSTNVGVDYGRQLRRSSSEREVRRLYERAGRVARRRPRPPRRGTAHRRRPGGGRPPDGGHVADGSAARPVGHAAHQRRPAGDRRARAGARRDGAPGRRRPRPAPAVHRACRPLHVHAGGDPHRARRAHGAARRRPVRTRTSATGRSTAGPEPSGRTSTWRSTTTRSR